MKQAQPKETAEYIERTGLFPLTESPRVEESGTSRFQVRPGAPTFSEEAKE